MKSKEKIMRRKCLEIAKTGNIKHSGGGKGERTRHDERAQKRINSFLPLLARH